MEKRVFITGMAGFIGFHLAKALKDQGHFVMGCDNYDPYYAPELKRARAERIGNVHDLSIEDAAKIEALIKENKITHVVHLAAQAGVRYSIQNPEKVYETNIAAFFGLLEILRASPSIHFTFASSSSVYGLNKTLPFSETDLTDQPANLYGASKKCNELMAFSYHHLYQIPMVGLRFFTAYGPWGRPDMAMYSFTDAILRGETIKVFNHGNMQRDFTYIDDIVSGIVAAMDYQGPFEVFNLGRGKSEKLLDMIHLIEEHTGKKAQMALLPMPKGEIEASHANLAKAQSLLHYNPKTSLEEGVKEFLDWHRNYHSVKL